MKITKYGHCCLLVEEGGIKILTDPGSFSKGHTELTGIDVLLITHEHEDHFHADAVEEILKNNPNIVVITNNGVGKQLDAKGIKYQVVGDGQSAEVKGVKITGHGTRHAEIWKEMGQVENTGYIIAEKFYLPGDSFHNPGVAVEILALPTAGPWLNFPDAIKFAIEMKPKVAFPVHDEILAGNAGWINQWLGQILQSEGVKLVQAEHGKPIEGLE